MLPLLLVWSAVVPGYITYKLHCFKQQPRGSPQSQKRQQEEEDKRELLSGKEDEEKEEGKKTKVMSRRENFLQESMLATSQVRYKYGLFYLEYTEEKFYWEGVKMLEKTVISIILSTQGSEFIIKGIFCFIIVFIYSLLVLFSKCGGLTAS